MNVASLLLALLPALALVLSLVRGHYPGERALSRWRSRRRRRAAAPPRPSPPSWTAWRRSGELLANALASRGPPTSPA
jgi:hypothetical protein